jgi:D-alanine-D-alanine ligase
MRKLNVLLLVDAPTPDNAPELKELMKDPNWKTESDVHRALNALGHTTRVVGISDDVAPLLQAVEHERPDIIFNLVEHFDNNAILERNVVALIEILGLPYTGSGPTGLTLCKNKGLMKKLMAYHKIKTPKFFILNRNKALLIPAAIRYPLFIKPVAEDASYGISQASYVESEEALRERVKFLHQNMGQDALVEEYIEGRELYVSVMGNKQLTVYSPREVVFREVPDDEPKIATYKAKWDENYREKWGIQNRFANPLADGVFGRIEQLCKKVYRVLHIDGYGRIDLRLTSGNDIMILEANPNPGISADEDVTLSVTKDGMSYNEFIQKVLMLGLQKGRVGSKQI